MLKIELFFFLIKMSMYCHIDHTDHIKNINIISIILGFLPDAATYRSCLFICHRWHTILKLQSQLYRLKFGRHRVCGFTNIIGRPSAYIHLDGYSIKVAYATYMKSIVVHYATQYIQNEKNGPSARYEHEFIGGKLIHRVSHGYYYQHGVIHSISVEFNRFGHVEYIQS